MQRSTAPGPQRRGGHRPALGVAVAAILLAGCTPQPPDLGHAARVLQSVAVVAGTDGSVVRIDGTAVGVGADPTQISTASTSYDPAKVAGDLPVRVRTSYRAGDASGSDLADLAGRSGRVEIEIVVENLTVHPEELTFDVAGRAASRAALVGAPLTIVASTSLHGVAPSHVVTQAETGAATNGVLSRDDTGDAVVQWAALLTPPTGGATATLRLVADVGDFAVPSFDLAVQPGLTSDASPSGAIGAAFDTSVTSPLALERRTIDVITSVDELLTRAGTTVAEVRTSLDATAETLGVRTAEELRRSAASTASSMQGLSGQLSALRDELSATVDGTESELVRQLSHAVGAVDAMLGDTSAPAPTSTLSGSGCAIIARAPEDATTIYGDLLRLVAELDGYGAAADSCRQQLVASLRDAVGPESPSAESCTTASVTCALSTTRSAVDGILQGLVNEGRALVTSLQPELRSGLSAEYRSLSARIDEVAATSDALAATPDSMVSPQLATLTTTVDALDDRAAALGTALDAIGTAASTALAPLGSRTDRESIAAQTADVARQLCDLTPSPAGTASPTPRASPALGREAIERIRSYLTDVPCSGIGDLDAPTGYPAPLDQRLAEQTEQWRAVARLTGSSGAGGELSRVRDALGVLRTAATAAAAATSAEGSSRAALLADLTRTTTSLRLQREALGGRVAELSQQQAGLAVAIREAFADADSHASSAVTAVIDEQVRHVTSRSDSDTAAVTALFDRSIAGLRATADDIRSEGAATLDAEHDALDSAESTIGAAVAESTHESLAKIAATIGASTRDTNAASALLAADLHKVLLDLGDRTVGGSGLLGSMTTSAAKVGTADVQLALASQASRGYAAVRAEDISGILLAQAQERASLDAGAALPAFPRDVDAGTVTRTVYSIHLGGRP
ncbi:MULTISPECIES: hypothetical protein [unclassified Rathayibacter]|uniref:hypothetical protein n=1 Tax=unclassified Rathayibacter TaxID=2609250 RepID=UPI00188BCB58|nr:MULTISPECIES: hypothetical protein [unclassified Rathayibacter]MBF4463383.1 hypothetical protein [Rathayibacter sp. VKM Ac-2879]MBF4504894.1 hypothetical protein [Rathayibacter sp. VKM Ac-2878]